MWVVSPHSALPHGSSKVTLSYLLKSARFPSVTGSDTEGLWELGGMQGLVAPLIRGPWKAPRALVYKGLHPGHWFVGPSSSYLSAHSWFGMSLFYLRAVELCPPPCPLSSAERDLARKLGLCTCD